MAKKQNTLQRIVDLQTLLLEFNHLERTMLLPSIPGKADRNETDTNIATLSLWPHGTYLKTSHISILINAYATRWCMTYMIYAGDTFVYDKQVTAHETKALREQRGVEELKRTWPDFLELTDYIEGYEHRQDKESRFVYALDKVMPMVLNHITQGKNYRRHGITLEDVKKAKAQKVAISPEVEAIYHELISIFESRPEYFEVNTRKMTDEEWLARAVGLSRQSPEPVGCGVVIVDSEGNVLAETYNSQRADNVAVYHAEIKAVMEANRKTNSRKLEGTTAYCSCEPCAMCLTALSYAKVDRIIFNKRMIDLFPDDPQSQLDPYSFAAGLNFSPKLQQIK